MAGRAANHGTNREPGKEAEALPAVEPVAEKMRKHMWLAARAAQMVPTAEPPSTGLAGSDRGRRRGNSASPQATCTLAEAADGVRPSEPVVMAEAARVWDKRKTQYRRRWRSRQWNDHRRGRFRDRHHPQSQGVKK